MSTTAPEYLTTLRDGIADAMQQWVDQSSSAWEQWAQTWTPVAEAGASALGMPSVELPWPGGGARARAGARPGQRGGHHHRHEHHDHGHHHAHGGDCGCGGQEKDCGCGSRESGRRKDRDCGCGEHASGCCRDACDCCVPEADVVVMARAGEVRVVPFRLHNPWRRERPVTLEVGPWHVCDGDGLEVRARLEETQLVLQPCEDRIVRLLVSARAVADGALDAADANQAKDTKAARAAKAEEAERLTDVRVDRDGGDVDSCSSAYADVRFEGCARPQRVAVVVLPADCDPVDVGCDCGCCC